MVCRTARFYRTHPRSRAKHRAYQRSLNKTSAVKKKRAERMRAKRAHDKKYGKASRRGKDASHTKHGIVFKSAHANRGSKTDTIGDRRARGKKRRK